MVAVADNERKRRPERPPVTEPGEHLDLVLLELLPRAAPVAFLASREIGVDRVPVEDEPCRQAGEDRDERRPVRLARGCQAQHQAERTAARIASTGAAIPVHSSNEAAPCRTSASSPSTTSAPAARAAATSAVSRPSG